MRDLEFSNEMTFHNYSAAMVLCGTIYILILKTGSLFKQHPEGIRLPYPNTSKFCLNYKNYFLKLCKGTSVIITQQQIIGSCAIVGAFVAAQC